MSTLPGWFFLACRRRYSSRRRYGASVIRKPVAANEPSKGAASSTRTLAELGHELLVREPRARRNRLTTKS